MVFLHFWANANSAGGGAQADTTVEPVAPAATAALRHPRQGLVLIVDDNPVNRLVGARAVNRLGYLTEAVSGGPQALEAVAASQFDAILLDCQMPGMDGYQTALEIRRREADQGHIPIIAATANAKESDQEKCLASGMDDYLSKPIRFAELEAALDRWVAHPAPVAPPLLFQNSPGHQIHPAIVHPFGAARHSFPVETQALRDGAAPRIAGPAPDLHAV